MASGTTLSTTTRRESKRFAKFLVVGTFGAAVDFGSFNVMFRVFNFSPVLAQTISFSLAVVSNFTWNRYWTYPESRSKPIARQFAQFFVLNLIAWLVRTPVFDALNDPFTDLVASSLDGPLAGLTLFATNTLHMTIEQLGNNIALGCAVIVVMFWNFFANRFITYSDVKFGH
jgi:putative flippase GtrA